MFEADVPAEWCERRTEEVPVSIPGWIAPKEHAAPAPVTSAMPARPEPPPEPPEPPASSRAPRVANEGTSPSIPAPSRRPMPQPGADPAEIERLHAALIEAVAVGLRARQEALAASERDLVHLALAIAGKVVGREVASDPAIVASWAREGIAALSEQDRVTVAISPDLAERLPPETWAKLLDGVEPVVDASLPPGGCEVRGAYGRVDAGLAPRLASVADALEGALPGGAGDEAA